MKTMNRRTFLAASAAPLLTPALISSAGAAPAPFSMSRISFITDEASISPADAVAFAKKHGLQWVELRDVPGAGKSYSDASEADIKETAKALKEAGLRVSFFNSRGTKYHLPGTESPSWATRAPEDRQKRIASAEADYKKRMELLQRQIVAGQILGVKTLRVFAFGRVAEPEKIMDRVANELGAMGEVARKEGMQLLLENEPSCNVGSCVEMADLIKRLPSSSFGLNWDANNGQSMKEKPFPDGYAALPKSRIVNVHMHGRTLLDPEKKLDWPVIFAALTKDGYKGCAGLETHYFDGTKVEKSHLCMEELARLLGKA